MSVSLSKTTYRRRLTCTGYIDTHRQDEKGGDSSGGDLEDVGTGMGLRNYPSDVKSGAYNAN